MPDERGQGDKIRDQKPTYSARARTYLCPPRGRTPVLLRPARAEVGGVRSDSKNVCARTHLVPPRVRISGQRGVSYANEKTQQSNLKKNPPAVPAAAFAGRSAAAAFSWLSPDGREEERRQGVSARYLTGLYASERGSGYGWDTDHYGTRNWVLRGGRKRPIHSIS